MNKKAYKALEYYKIIDLLTDKASSPGSLTVEYKKKCLQALWCLLFLRQIFRFIL